MNKQELVAVVAEKMGTTNAEASRFVNTVFDTVTATLCEGECVKLSGFGSFEVKERAERKGFIPGTTTQITIPAKKVVGFKAAKTLKDSL